MIPDPAPPAHCSLDETDTFPYPFEVLRCPPERFSRSFPDVHHDAGDGGEGRMMPAEDSMCVAVGRETGLRAIEAST